MPTKKIYHYEGSAKALLFFYRRKSFRAVGGKMQ